MRSLLPADCPNSRVAGHPRLLVSPRLMSFAAARHPAWRMWYAVSGRSEGGRHPMDTNRYGCTGETPRSIRSRRLPEGGLPARPWVDWLMPIAVLTAASVALVSDGALFHESGQLAAVVVVLCLGLVLTVSRWSRVRVLLGSRLGLLAVVDGAVLVISAVLSVYHWASIREVLKAAALGEAFLLGAALIDREALRDRFLVLFYWWSVVAAGSRVRPVHSGDAMAAELARELCRADAGDLNQPSQRVLRVRQRLRRVPAGPDSDGSGACMAGRAQGHGSAGRADHTAVCHAIGGLALGLRRPGPGTHGDAHPGHASCRQGRVPAHARRCGHLRSPGRGRSINADAWMDRLVVRP